MPWTRCTDAKIAMVVRELDNGAKVADISRRLGVSEQTVYTWKKRFAGMGTTEIRRPRQLEEKNGKLKKLVAEVALDKVMLLAGRAVRRFEARAAGARGRTCRSSVRSASVDHAG